MLLDIAIPVFNEERQLEASVQRLRRYLDHHFPFDARITVVDNGSTDGTWAIAQRLTVQLAGVRALRLAQRGRGRAIRQVWMTSDAEIVSYMDVDLSTGLNALLPLIAPIISGHSQLSVGSRLAPGARVLRGLKREVISRGYNGLLHVMLGTTVQDAQCGFKAMPAQTARQLLPMVKNDHWFFDTELLVVAQRSGLRIHELPVDWTDDPDTRVAIVPTAIEDLRGVWRLSHQVRSFAVIGILSTAGYVACYGVLRDFLSAESANVVSLLLTAIGNTAANRRFTFNAQNNGAASRDHLAGLVAFAAALAISSTSLVLLDVLAPSASRVEEIVVLVAAGIVGTALRFVLLRSWIKPRVPTVVPRRLAPGKVPSPIGKQTREAVLQKTA